MQFVLSLNQERGVFAARSFCTLFLHVLSARSFCKISLRMLQIFDRFDSVKTCGPEARCDKTKQKVGERSNTSITPELVTATDERNL